MRYLQLSGQQLCSVSVRIYPHVCGSINYPSSLSIRTLVLILFSPDKHHHRGLSTRITHSATPNACNNSTPKSWTITTITRTPNKLLFAIKIHISTTRRILQHSYELLETKTVHITDATIDAYAYMLFIREKPVCRSVGHCQSNYMSKCRYVIGVRMAAVTNGDSVVRLDKTLFRFVFMRRSIAHLSAPWPVTKLCNYFNSTKKQYFGNSCNSIIIICVAIKYVWYTNWVFSMTFVIQKHNKK